MPKFVPLFLTLLLAVLVCGPAHAQTRGHFGQSGAVILGGGYQRFEVMDEIVSPVNWEGSGGQVHFGAEFLNSKGVFTVTLDYGQSSMTLKGHDGSETISVPGGNFYRSHSQRAALVLGLDLEQDFALDREGVWHWWLGPRLNARTEQTGTTSEDLFDETGLGVLGIGPAVKSQWFPGWDLEIRGALSLPLFGWLVRGPWSGFDNEYDWTENIRFQWVGEFFDVDGTLAVRRGVWRWIGLEAAYQFTYHDDDITRHYRSLTQWLRLSAVGVF
jgi:hypothetical protein